MQTLCGRLARWWGVAVLVVVVAACDSGRLIAPTPDVAPPGAPLRLNTAAVALGEAFIQPPATSHPNDVAAPPFQAFAQAPAGTWIIIRTSGQVQTRFNEACGEAASPFWQCQTGNQRSPFSPDFPSTVGPVQVALQRAGGKPSCRCGEWGVGVLDWCTRAAGARWRRG